MQELPRYNTYIIVHILPLWPYRVSARGRFKRHQLFDCLSGDFELLPLEY